MVLRHPGPWCDSNHASAATDVRRTLHPRSQFTNPALLEGAHVARSAGMTAACRLAGLAWVPVALFLPACSSSAEGGSLADSGSGGGESDSSTGSSGDSATPDGNRGPADATPDTAVASDAPLPDVTTQDTGTRDVIVPDAFTQDSGNLSVTWQGGCWYSDQGHKYQAMRFTLQTSAPIPLEGTLFFTTTCDPSQGTDNLNDTGSTINSGSWTFWFIHHPDEFNTSATWSLGNLSSGCIDYSTAPDC